MRTPSILHVTVRGGAVAAIVLALVVSMRPPELRRPPNLVVIIVDTLRADYVGTYGFRGAISPELDRFSRMGARFEKVMAQSSWTRPSIASMITSQHARSLGIYQAAGDLLAASARTLAEVLREHGYATVGVTANPNLNTTFQMHQGFDKYVDSSVVFEWMQPGSDQLQKRESVPLANARQIFDETKAILTSYVRRPVYVQVCLMDVHEHWEGPEGTNATGVLGGENSPYARAVSLASMEIGNFIAWTRTRADLRNTLFVITSDHGEGLSDHPGVFDSTGHGNVLYESNLLVPLILYNPMDERLRGVEVSQEVRLLDLMPTLLDYLGVGFDPRDLEGRSLLPLLLREVARVALPRFFVAETNWANVDKIAAYSSEMIYIENRDGWEGVPPRELQARGTQQNGHATDRLPRVGDVAIDLREKLRAWELQHPKQPPLRTPRALTPQDRQQLESLGYID